MQGDFVNKQVIETKGNLHKKAKEAQYKNFQHKTRKLDIIEIHKNTFPSLIVNFSIMHKLNYIAITRTIIAMITYSNRKHRNTSSHNTTLRNNIRGILTKDSVSLFFIFRNKVFHICYYRFINHLFIRFNSFICTFINHTSYHRMFLYLNWERHFLNVWFR